MTRKIDPATRCLKVSAWPISDQHAWANANRAGTLLRPGQPVSKWSATTRQTMIESYGRWLNWLQRHGSLDPAGEAAQQVLPENVLAYVEDLSAINASSTVVNRIRCLFFMCAVLAPGRDREWLRSIWYNLQRRSVPARDKRARLVEAPELLVYGFELMADAGKASNKTLFERAVQYRDGLLLAFLVARPLRLRNLSAMELGRHLVRTGDDYWILFVAEETKNHRCLELPFPAGLRVHLERYLSHYRPLLFPLNRGSRKPVLRDPGECHSLWVSIQGTPMDARTIYGRVTALTKAKFGRSINPHLVRDAAATAIATYDPQHVGIAMPVLGHSSTKTSQRYYDQSRTIEAMRRHHHYVDELSRSSPDRGPNPSSNDE